MTLQIILLHINALACGLIALRLMLFNRQGAKHKWLGAIGAYVLIVAAASVPIRIITGTYIAADISETLINIMFCGLVLRARGNFMQLFRNPI
ncbi:holin [Hafnia phage yong2]|jgi:hypothetical protein|uniref:phage holin family protein n=1 Tax=Hafnia paralvei TaxID=546367 RepID=UPI0018F0E7AE|nr:phage holin family protein [Hafnia paralvei]MBW2958092.1 phage holin family protein [Hafnia paralvei]QXN68778.1 holin [Hafnia phage yong2]